MSGATLGGAHEAKTKNASNKPRLSVWQPKRNWMLLTTTSLDPSPVASDENVAQANWGIPSSEKAAELGLNPSPTETVGNINAVLSHHGGVNIVTQQQIIIIE